MQLITRLEIKNPQTKNHLRCLEEGSEPEYNILHKRAVQPKLLSPKCPSTTSPTACRRYHDSVYVLSPHRNCDTVVCIGPRRWENPAIQANGVQTRLLCNTHGRLGQSFSLDCFFVFGHNTVSFCAADALFDTI